MTAEEYKALIQKFLTKSISVKTFEKRFLKAFSKESDLDKDLFDILENLFEDLDAYSPMWTLQDEIEKAYRITEPTLRKEAETALQALEQYLLRHQ